MSAVDREQQRLQKRLVDILKRPENLTCAECSSRLPRWASTSLGVFFCTSCSGSHRGLGVHISKVKSTTLDKWTEAQVDFVSRLGNARANAYWEANVPVGKKPTPTWTRDQCERFIREKYERKMYVDETRSGPEEEASGTAAQATQATQAVAQPAQANGGGAFDLLSLNDTASAPVSGTNGASAAFASDQWSDFYAMPAAAPTTALNGSDQWSDSSVAPATVVPTAAIPIADDGWGDFASAPTAAPQAAPAAPVAPPKREVSKNDIMNLFDTPASGPTMPIGGASATPFVGSGFDQLQGGVMASQGGVPMGAFQQQQMQPQMHWIPGIGQQPAMPGMGQQPQTFQGYGYQPRPQMMPQMIMQQQFMGAAGAGAQQFGYMPQQQQQYGTPQMDGPMPPMGGTFVGNQFAQAGVSAFGAPASPQKPPADTQNIPEFKW